MADDDNFLSRWSRRKALVRHGLPVPEPVPAAPVPPMPATTRSPGASAVPAQGSAAGLAATAAATAQEPVAAPLPPAPTLEDVAQLPADAQDYSRFVAPGVGTDVKNAALKKLFADPHFNVMDGLDIYIDDYSKPDPLPPEMLRQMVQSRFLGLFDGEEDKPSSDTATLAPAGVGAGADPGAGAQAPGRATPEPAHLADGVDPVPPTPLPQPLCDTPAPDTLSHEDADLRLQPHPAAGSDGAAPGAVSPERHEH